MCATLFFLVVVCYNYVFDKEQDFLVSYVITFSITTVIFVWSSYERWLLNKAQSALNRHDYQTAFAITEKLAKKDHHEAQFNLSLMYRDGIGTAKDDSQFWYWLEKSAVVDADAQLLYANAYLQNHPYDKETLEVARRYLHKFIQHKKHPRQPEGLEQLARIEQLLDIERKNHRP